MKHNPVRQEVLSLMSTSVSDAKIDLECMASSNPLKALKLAVECLEHAQDLEGHISKKKVFSSVARKAIKKLEEKF